MRVVLWNVSESQVVFLASTALMDNSISVFQEVGQSS